MYNNSKIQQFETQFDRLIMTDTLLKIKKCIVMAYEIVTFGMYTLEERKNLLVEVWSLIVDTIKQSEDMNSFEIIFISQKALGEIYLDFKDFIEAVRVFKSIKILCEDFQKFREKMFIYE